MLDDVDTGFLFTPANVMGAAHTLGARMESMSELAVTDIGDLSERGEALDRIAEVCRLARGLQSHLLRGLGANLAPGLDDAELSAAVLYAMGDASVAADPSSMVVGALEGAVAALRNVAGMMTAADEDISDIAGAGWDVVGGGGRPRQLAWGLVAAALGTAVREVALESVNAYLEMIGAPRRLVERFDGEGHVAGGAFGVVGAGDDRCRCAVRP